MSPVCHRRSPRTERRVGGADRHIGGIRFWACDAWRKSAMMRGCQSIEPYVCSFQFSQWR